MHTTIRRTGAALFLIGAGAALVALAAGCGGAAPSTRDSVFPEYTTTRPAPTNVPEATAQLDQAESDLNQALGVNGSPTFAQPVQPTELQQKTPSTEGQGAPPSSPPPTAAADSAGAPPDPCVTACRALASMGRCADHVCSLAGDTDEHCSSARDRVSRATDRVRERCPSC